MIDHIGISVGSIARSTALAPLGYASSWKCRRRRPAAESQSAVRSRLALAAFRLAPTRLSAPLGANSRLAEREDEGQDEAAVELEKDAKASQTPSS
jgi:hypothetical protein